jgi:hypothetical protein
MPGTPVRVNPKEDPLGSTLVGTPPRVREYGEEPAHTAIDRVRLLLDQRLFLFRVTAYGVALATLIAFLIPKTYEARTQLMPPDS